jgi:hypothetical protein
MLAPATLVARFPAGGPHRVTVITAVARASASEVQQQALPCMPWLY